MQLTTKDVKSASRWTLEAQARMLASLPVDDGQDDDYVRRGFVATLKDGKVVAPNGHVVWDAKLFDWVQGDAPPTVNPSLWRQIKLLKEHGLYQVAEGVWQARNLCVSNTLIVQGDTGWIIVDPLLTTETMGAVMDLVEQHLGKRPITGVLYTHSHPDHHGGVRALISEDSNIPIIAPEFFMEEVASESVITGNLVARRTSYQFGEPVRPGPQGNVGGGLATDVSEGTTTLIPPNDYIKQTGDRRVIDGVTFEFQMVPETEAPSEMNLYLPAQKTLFISEFAICTMHNVQTPRGAKVRDTLKWAGYLTELLDLYGDEAEVEVFGHCWPRFGNAAVRNHLRMQRDAYKFIHDQTVRRMVNGQTPTEFAEELKLPTAVANDWSTRGYYGTVKHNAKGVYQFYVGWWDGIPAHLDLYPPVEQGKRYVAAMGGAKGVINEAIKAMDKGDYRWSSELLNHVVFAEPDNDAARNLLADSYEQLGYQAESAIWRNIYLTGAQELRIGILPRTYQPTPPTDLIDAMSTTAFLNLVATRLNPDKIGDRSVTAVLKITDTRETALITVCNAVLVGEVGKSISAPDVTLSGPRSLMMGFFLGKAPLDKLEASGLHARGDKAALLALQDAIEPPLTDYPIVAP